VARSTVELIVDAARAINPLKRVTVETKKLEGAVKNANGRLRDAKGRFIGVGNGAKKASGGVKSLSTAVKGLFIGLSAIEAAKFVFFKTAELQTQTKSLQVLTGSLKDAEGIIKSLQGFAAITPFTSEELIDTAKRLKAFGFETGELVDIVSRLGDVAGATGADLGGIATAFGQIQAKGRLQGEELLQLQERGVDLQGTLRKEYGLTKEQFKKALESGRINAEAVSFALRKLTDEGGKYANGAIAQSDTLSGRFSTLVDNISAIARRVGEVLTPAVNGLLKSLNESLAAFNALIAVSGSAAVTQANIKLALPGGDAKDLLEIANVLKALPKDPANKELAAQLKTIGARQLDVIGNFGILMRASGRKLPEAYQTALDAAKELMSVEVKLTKKTGSKPELDDPRTTLLQTDPAEQARQVVEQLERQVGLLEEKKLLAVGKTSEDKAQIQLGIKIANLEKLRTVENSDLVDKVIEGTQALHDQELATAANIETDKERKKLAEEAQTAQQQALEAYNKKLEEVDATFRNSVVDGIMAAVEGTKSLSDSLVGVIKQMARLILQQKLMNALKGFSFTSFFGGFFADGGRPPVGRPSIVGERGPELFVPGRSGTIVPNHELGGGGGTSVVVNVDASGTNVEGDEGSSRQLGALVGAAVQNELIKQQRPGGLLSR
jgi:tape measure domain-containing protein